MSKRKAFIFDIDGTLALMGKREPHDYSKVGEDKVNKPVREMLWALYESFDILIFTGRPLSCHHDTENWLRRMKIPYTKLFMRRTEDPDHVIKEHMYDVMKNTHKVLGVFEDRKRVKKMWVKLGIFVFDVNQHDKEY